MSTTHCNEHYYPDDLPIEEFIDSCADRAKIFKSFVAYGADGKPYAYCTLGEMTRNLGADPGHGSFANYIFRHTYMKAIDKNGNGNIENMWMDVISKSDGSLCPNNGITPGFESTPHKDPNFLQELKDLIKPIASTFGELKRKVKETL